MALLEHVFYLLAALLGAGLVWTSVRSARQTLRVLTTPRTGARDVTPGPARLVGTVRLPDGGVRGPLTGRECAVASWEIRQGAGSGRLETELAADYEAVPFRLEDGTGAVRVEIPEDPAFLEVDIDVGDGWDEPVFEVDYGEPRPARAAALESRADVRDWPDLAPGLESAAGTHRRYHEWRLEAGDEATVYGHARRKGGRTVVSPTADGTFLVSTGDLARRLAFRTGVLAVAGLFFLGAAVHEYSADVPVALPV